MEKGTPSQYEAILLAGLCGKWWSLSIVSMHFTSTHCSAAGDTFWVASACLSYNKSFNCSCVHGKSNGCLVRWKLHTPFCSSRTLLVLQWPIYCSCFPWNLKWCLAKINKSNGYLANCIHLFLPCWTMKHPELTKSSLYNFLHASKSLESTDVNFTYPPLKFVTACFCCAGNETWWLIHDCLPQVTAKPIR